MKRVITINSKSVLLSLSAVSLVLGCSDGRSQASPAAPPQQKSYPSIRLVKEVTHFDVDAHVAAMRARSEACLIALARDEKKTFNPREVISEADARAIGSGTVEEYFQGDHYARFEMVIAIPEFLADRKTKCSYDLNEKSLVGKIVKGCKTWLWDSEKKISESIIPPEVCATTSTLVHNPGLSDRKAKILGHECTYLKTIADDPAKCLLSAYPIYPVPMSGGFEVHLMDDLVAGKNGRFKLNATEVLKEIEIGKPIPVGKFEIPSYAAGFAMEKME